MKYIIKVIFSAVIAVIPAVAACQSTSVGAMPQFLFSDFKEARVTMKSGQVQNPKMNYNIISGRMVFVRDKKYYDLTNPEMVDTVYLQDGKFIPFGKEFYELLVSGTNKLFAEYRGDLLSAGKPAAYGGTSQVSSSNYISTVQLSGMQYNLPLPEDFIVKQSIVYWIRKNGEMSNFNNEKQFLKLFPAESVSLKSYIRENRIKFDRPEQISKLVEYLNTL